MDSFLSALEGYDHIIWDWNGTLLDDVAVCIDVVSIFLREEGLPIPDQERYREIFGFPIKEYYQRLGFSFEHASFEDLADRYMAIYDQRARGAALHDGVPDVLSAVAARGQDQSILTAAAEWHVLEMLDHFDIARNFRHVFGVADNMAASKEGRGKELVATATHKARGTLLIGDTDHDLEVGRELGVDVLLVAHGHQSHERLLRIHDNVVEGFRQAGD